MFPLTLYIMQDLTTSPRSFENKKRKWAIRLFEYFRICIITWCEEICQGTKFHLTILLFTHIMNTYLIPTYSVKLQTYHHLPIMYHKCILSNWNKLFLRDIYIPRAGVAMAVSRMIRYGYSFLLSFNCIFQPFNSSGVSILLYGYRCHVILCIGQLHPILDDRNVFWGARCSGVKCHCVFPLRITLKSAIS